MTQYGTPNHDPHAAFTPKPALYNSAMSPVSPSYAGGGMGGESARYSPHPMQSPAMGAAKTPGYSSTPVYGYTGSPAYGAGGGGYGDSGIGGFSPAASQHSAYSPTGLAYQSPSYSPTTPNYG